jgi:hypothetical protein
VVGIAFQEVFINTIQREPGDLSAAGIIEEDRRTVQRWELAAN